MSPWYHGINKRGGKVSVTTDGFITNLENLESLIEYNFLLKEFKSIRFNLSNDKSGLELKSFGKVFS